MNVGPPELLIILVIVLLLFGASRLPKLARSLGEASREFKKGIHDDDRAKPVAERKPDPRDDGGAGRGAPAPGGADEKITMTKAELDALLAEREARGRRDAPPAV